jgi:hypothetical protein
MCGLGGGEDGALLCVESAAHATAGRVAGGAGGQHIWAPRVARIKAHKSGILAAASVVSGDGWRVCVCEGGGGGGKCSKGGGSHATAGEGGWGQEAGTCWAPRVARIKAHKSGILAAAPVLNSLARSSDVCAFHASLRSTLSFLQWQRSNKQPPSHRQSGQRPAS